jgi:hypothetical protein
MDLNQDFYEFFTSLINHDVRFLVVGGYAMAAHGHPRFTKDLDVWVWMDPANGEAVMAALDFNEPDTVVQLGYPPKRIDVLTTPSGVTFDECWPDRLVVSIDQLQIPVLGLQGLIDNKLAAGRDQDLVDVAALHRVLRRQRP